MSRFDYDAEGHSLVLADGRELLVYDGATEAPRWRADAGGTLVGVVSNAVAIVSLDAEGTLKIWSHETATEVRAHALGVPATALVGDYEGHTAVVHPAGVVTLVGGERRDHAVAGATHAAFSGVGELLVGAADGALTCIDAAGTVVGTARVPGPVQSVAWNPGGFFFVGNGGAVHRLDGLEVSRVTNAPDAAPVRGIACSASGDRVALHIGDKLAVVLEYPSRDTVGSAQYVDRTVCGVAFGPAPWLGVGLDGGDGNKFDLTTGATHRTDTHPGRAHNRWMLMAGFGPPKGAAPPSPPAAASAPRAPAPVAAPVPPPSSGASAVVIGIAVVSVVLFVLGLVLAIALG